MTKVTFSIFFQQLSRDIIGKDSYRGVTLSYSWLANQFGHFSLGFIPNTLLFVLLSSKIQIDNFKLLLYTTIGVGLFWLLFETFNVIKSIVKKDEKDSIFPIAWGNVLYDTCVDVTFFIFGSISASLVFHFFNFFFVIGLILTIFLIISFIYWYQVKIYLQSAEFPFQMRLSQWKFSIDDENKLKAENIFTNKKHKQIIILGGKGSGKTSLAVAIATELAIKYTASYYTTAIKFPELCSESDVALKANTLDYWTWREASCLIIDDIQPIVPFYDSITPDYFKEAIENSSTYVDINKAGLCNKTTIWVLGQTSQLETWKSFINSITNNTEEVICIELP